VAKNWPNEQIANMNWQQLHIKNEDTIQSYMDYLFHPCTQLSHESRLKLVTEIGRLKLQNKLIEGMTLEDYYQPVLEYQIKIPA